MNFFGTDGIRKKVGEYPLTKEGVFHIGKALARWALKKYKKHPTFLVASDTRASCTMIKEALFSAFSHYPLSLYDAGTLPTPAVFHLIADDPSFTCGIIISASHNTAEDNGIKLVDAVSGKLTVEDELELSALILEAAQEQVSPQALKQIPIVAIDVEDYYCNKIMEFFPANLLKGTKIVLDCAYGATYRVAPRIFSELGAELIVLHDKPDGSNINKECGATNLKRLQKAVIEHNAFIGIAFDGDGDRCMAVASSGKELDGDDILALLLTNPDFEKTSTIVSTVMANQGLEAYLSSQGKKLIRTKVGDKHILAALKKENLPLGGEPSGHTIISPLSTTGDGILVALKTIETIIFTGNFSCKTFDKYPQACINVPVKEKRSLADSPYVDYIAAIKERLTTGRLLVRYSGTEPLLRIMVEDKDPLHCSEIALTLAQQLQKYLS